MHAETDILHGKPFVVAMYAALSVRALDLEWIEAVRHDAKLAVGRPIGRAGEHGRGDECTGIAITRGTLDCMEELRLDWTLERRLGLEERSKMDGRVAGNALQR